MKLRTLALVVMALILSSCAIPGASSSTAAPKGKHCSDLVAASILHETAGAYDCLADVQKRAAAIYLITDDSSLAKQLHDKTAIAVTYLGTSGDGGFVYVTKHSDSGTNVQLFWTDADGKIIDLGYSAHP